MTPSEELKGYFVDGIKVNNKIYMMLVRLSCMILYETIDL